MSEEKEEIIDVFKKLDTVVKNEERLTSLEKKYNYLESKYEKNGEAIVELETFVHEENEQNIEGLTIQISELKEQVGTLNWGKVMQEWYDNLICSINEIKGELSDQRCLFENHYHKNDGENRLSETSERTEKSMRDGNLADSTPSECKLIENAKTDPNWNEELNAELCKGNCDDCSYYTPKETPSEPKGLSIITKHPMREMEEDLIREFIQKINYIIIKNYGVRYRRKLTRYKYIYYDIQSDLLKLRKGLNQRLTKDDS